MTEDIVHCPSRQKGTILGYHRGQKYFMVKTDTGQIQNWRQSSTHLLKEDYMTSKILMTLTGTRGKMFDVIDRVFNNIDEAREYLAELTRLDEIKDFDKSGQLAKLTNGWTVQCNYDIREILKKKPPTKDLWDFYPFDLQKKMRQKTKAPLAMPHNTHPPASDKHATPTLSAPAAKKSTGKMVKLQDITQDGRGARVVLRELVRKKQLVKQGRWEWAEGSAELELVRKALKK